MPLPLLPTANNPASAVVDFIMAFHNGHLRICIHSASRAAPPADLAAFITVVTKAAAAKTWSRRWPYLGDIAHDSLALPAHNVLANNTYCNCGQYADASNASIYGCAFLRCQAGTRPSFPSPRKLVTSSIPVPCAPPRSRLSRSRFPRSWR